MRLAMAYHDTPPGDKRLEHFNDLNYPEDDSTSFIADSAYELNYTSAYPRTTGMSTIADASEFDTESKIESQYTESRINMKSTSDFDEDSRYPEVRATVSPVDDPSIPANTFRAFFIGTLCIFLVSLFNTVFAYRQPGASIALYIVQIPAYFLGRAMHAVLPSTRFRTFGISWSLNPGPFTIKEHSLITMMAYFASQGVYCLDVGLARKYFFHEESPFGFDFLLALSQELLLVGLAGFVIPLFVWPSQMIMPSILPFATILNVLNSNNSHSTQSFSRKSHKVLFMVLAGTAVWSLLPEYLFTALSVFDWVCWIAPNNVVVNQVFGYETGLGLSVLTFDWAMITYLANPLVIPLWAQINFFIAGVATFVIIPIIYYTGICSFYYFPPLSLTLFDRFGAPYDFTSVVNSDGSFSTDLYRQYSSVFISAGQILSIMVNFASAPSVLIHVFLWYRKDIVHYFRAGPDTHHDVHSRLMAAYKKVPMYWFAIVTVVAIVLAIVNIEVYHTGLSIWAFLVVILLAYPYGIGCSFIQAISGLQTGSFIPFEILFNVMQPEQPIAAMVFKGYGAPFLSGLFSVLSVYKLGHYMKIAPRVTFCYILYTAVLISVITVSTVTIMGNNLVDFCSTDQPDLFKCPGTRIYADAALLYNGIGAQRIFGAGQRYTGFIIAMPFLALLPIPFYLLARKYPTSLWRYINIPIMLAASGSIPPYNFPNFALFIVIGVIFQYYLRRYHQNWWSRYNFLLAGSLDGGLDIALLIIFFAFELPNVTGVTLNWWGNTVWLNTADANGIPFKIVNGTIGPDVWS